MFVWLPFFCTGFPRKVGQSRQKVESDAKMLWFVDPRQLGFFREIEQKGEERLFWLVVLLYQKSGIPFSTSFHYHMESSTMSRVTSKGAENGVRTTDNKSRVSLHIDNVPHLWKDIIGKLSIHHIMFFAYGSSKRKWKPFLLLLSLSQTFAEKRKNFSLSCQKYESEKTVCIDKTKIYTLKKQYKLHKDILLKIQIKRVKSYKILPS